MKNKRTIILDKPNPHAPTPAPMPNLAWFDSEWACAFMCMTEAHLARSSSLLSRRKVTLNRILYLIISIFILYIKKDSWAACVWQNDILRVKMAKVEVSFQVCLLCTDRFTLLFLKTFNLKSEKAWVVLSLGFIFLILSLCLMCLIAKYSTDRHKPRTQHGKGEK